MSGSKLVNFLFAVIFVILGVFASVFLYRDYQHLDHLRSQKDRKTDQLEALEAEVALKSQRAESLRSDPDFAEDVIRERLKYAKEDEVIFRFE